MDGYLFPIKTAILVFPLIAFIISAPFILIQYHEYGSLSFLRALIIYSLVLYLLCAYFLVILPLPKIDEVALLTTDRTQFIPFRFIMDFINETSFDVSNVHTYFKALKESCFYVPIYNIVLTVPFGMYLRYYYKCNLKKTILFTFLLSLFFELTQLSGLYFVYPRGYRLFDVDDLMLNTLGGLVGYFISKPIISLLPKRDKIDMESRKRGKIISGFRRTTSLFLDFFIVLILYLIAIRIVNYKLIYIPIIVFYYFIIPIFLKNRTLGQKFLNIQIISYNDNISIFRYIIRNILFILIYFIIPYTFFIGISSLGVNDEVEELAGVICLIGMFIFYAVTGIRYLFTNKPMIYEKISKTKLVSTVK